MMTANLDGLYPEGQVIQTCDLLCFCVSSFFRKLTMGTPRTIQYNGLRDTEEGQRDHMGDCGYQG